MSKRKYKLMKTIYIIALLLMVFTKGYSLEQIKISVDNVQRDFLLYVPENSTQEKLPVVFVFHGYGQELTEAIGKFKIEKYWPEAIVVYPRGLRTVIQKMETGGAKSGWQTYVGDYKDRDIRLFDEILIYLKNKCSIDENRIYVTGFSNGAAFSYVIATVRRDIIAAIAPIAGTLGSNKDRNLFKEIPVFHVAGKQDEIVKFKSQKEMIEFIKKINKCNDEGIVINKNVTEYKSAIDKPLTTFIYNDIHKIPGDAIPFIVEFFKNNTLTQ